MQMDISGNDQQMTIELLIAMPDEEFVETLIKNGNYTSEILIIMITGYA